MGKKGAAKKTRTTTTDGEDVPAPMPPANLPPMDPGEGDGGANEDRASALGTLEAELAECESEFKSLAGIEQQHAKLEKAYRDAIERRRTTVFELDREVEARRQKARNYNQTTASPAKQRREDLERRIAELQGIIERQREALAAG